MKDPILDRIYKARAMLLEKHGGWDGYVKHIQKLELARIASKKKLKKRKGGRLSARLR
jgi:hypothetical protein